MSENVERPPKGELLRWVSAHDPRWIGAHKFFDDPDCIATELECNEQGEVQDTLLYWAVRDVGLQATLFALRDVLTQGDYEEGKAYLLRTNPRASETLNFFSRSNEHRHSLLGGMTVELEGEPVHIIAEILDGQDRDIWGFGFDNGQIAIDYQPKDPMKFHDIPTDGLFLRESAQGTLTRMIADQCIAATAREGLLADVDQTLDEFGEYIPGLRR